jgi:hypothetical protein
MVQVEKEQILKIGQVLNDKNRPMKERFRALRNIGGENNVLLIHQFC